MRTIVRPVAVGTIGLALLVSACSSSNSTGANGNDPGSSTTSPVGTAGSTASKAVKPAQPTKVTAPTVKGPLTGGKHGKPFNPLTKADADKYGYTEHEYTIEGTATSYSADGTFGEDGKWPVKTSASTAPYTTRIVVRLPRDKTTFNGTVLAEWLNVTSGMDADPDFGFSHTELLRSGYGYIAVSAQLVGINGGARIPIPGFDVKALKEWDPVRYADLSHPGDQYSYDIFSQAAATTLDPLGVDPFDGYEVTSLLATGESQSAGRMTTYVNAIHPVVRLFDGFLIHSRGPSGAAINATENVVPAIGHIRGDLTEPVLQVQAETDLFGLGFYPARQPDTDNLRTWELAGTAHADQFTLDYGIESGHEWDPTASIDFTELCGVLNKGPQTFLIRAAVAGLRSWVADGTAPPMGPLIEVADKKVARDADGNAKGGIRTPLVDVPVATLSGEPGGASSAICSLFGFTKPFTADRLAALYQDQADYVAKYQAATTKAINAGFLLPADEAEVNAITEQTAFGG